MSRRRKEKEAKRKARERKQAFEDAAVRSKGVLGNRRDSDAARTPAGHRLLTAADQLGPDTGSAKFVDLAEPTKSRILCERVDELFGPTLIDGRVQLLNDPSAATVRDFVDEIT